MNLDSKRLVAVFFIPAKDAQGSIVDLLEKGCATQISVPKDDMKMANCLWATWNCEGYVISSPNYKILCIYFWQSDFLESLDEVVKPIEQDGLFFLIESFECACNELLPELGFIATHLWQANLNFIQEREKLLLGRDIISLLKEHLGLTYFKEEIITDISIDSQIRDTLKINSGLLVFAGKEDSRWF